MKCYNGRSTLESTCYATVNIKGCDTFLKKYCMLTIALRTVDTMKKCNSIRDNVLISTRNALQFEFL